MVIIDPTLYANYVKFESLKHLHLELLANDYFPRIVIYYLFPK